jgi:hypothetical protein
LKVLIAGGAGYIGSTIASACLDSGISPVILDSLVTGRREFTAGREFYEGDIADGPLVDRIFAEHPDIDAVIHLRGPDRGPRLGGRSGGVLPGERGKEPGVRRAPAAQRLPAADLQFVGRHLPQRRRRDTG